MDPWFYKILGRRREEQRRRGLTWLREGLEENGEDSERAAPARRVCEGFPRGECARVMPSGEEEGDRERTTRLGAGPALNRWTGERSRRRPFLYIFIVSCWTLESLFLKSKPNRLSRFKLFPNRKQPSIKKIDFFYVQPLAERILSCRISQACPSDGKSEDLLLVADKGVAKENSIQAISSVLRELSLYFDHGCRWMYIFQCYLKL